MHHVAALLPVAALRLGPRLWLPHVLGKHDREVERLARSGGKPARELLGRRDLQRVEVERTGIGDRRRASNATAQAIGRQLGLSQGRPLRVLESNALDSMPPELFAELANDVDVFARVRPAHKLKIVQALQSAGMVVAMAGPRRHQRQARAQGRRARHHGAAASRPERADHPARGPRAHALRVGRRRRPHLGIRVRTFGAGQRADGELSPCIKDVLDFRVAAIVRDLRSRELPGESKKGLFRGPKFDSPEKTMAWTIIRDIASSTSALASPRFFALPRRS